MSLVSTLAKVAIGIAVAKGVSHITRNGLPGTQKTADRGTVGRGTPYGGQKSGAAPGGLADMMGDLLGGKTAGAARGTGAGQPAGGGLGGLLEQLAGGQTQTGTRRPTRTQRVPGQNGGLGDLLGGLTGAKTGQSGGIGDLLGGLLGGAATGGGIGGLGSLLTDAMAGKATAPPSAEQEVAAALMLKAMVQAAKSDNKLDGDEKQKLMEAVGDASPQEIKFINDLLAQPVDIEGLAADVPEGLEAQVYLMSLMAIDLDAKAEAQYLHDLATALGMPQDMVNELHDQAGAQRLYS